MELNEVRREREELGKRAEEYENAIRQEREKQSKNMNELLLMQKEVKDWRNKADQVAQELAQARDEVHLLKTRTKQDERNLTAELERLTSEFNNLQTLYRQKESELESARRRPLEEATRKKNNFDHTRELVDKLEKEEMVRKAGRASPTKAKESVSPRARGYSRSYKEEKEDYLTMIESVGSMESQMLGCNMEKKKILAEMDKIDETRVKTKEMISRRRRLEVELQNQERRLDHIKNELKKMKVM
jgi:chromosome segregation ATPase